MCSLSWLVTFSLTQERHERKWAKRHPQRLLNVGLIHSFCVAHLFELFIWAVGTNGVHLCFFGAAENNGKLMEKLADMQSPESHFFVNGKEWVELVTFSGLLDIPLFVCV